MNSTNKNTKKDDGRVKYTKMRIRSAFYELINEMQPEKITVTAICNKAEINRATFYKHYLDVPDLINKLQEDSIQTLSEMLNTIDNTNIESCMIEMLQFVKGVLHTQPIISTLSMPTIANFTAKISHIIYRKFSEMSIEIIPNPEIIDKRIVFAYISSGCAGIIDYWAKTGFKETEEAIAEKIMLLASSTFNIHK